MNNTSSGWVIAFAIFLTGCAAKPISMQDLVGYWYSISIIYPRDPVFAEQNPDTKPGSAAFRFENNNRFQLQWNDTNLAGNYRLSGRRLILNGDGEKESTVFRVKREQKHLILQTEDGFVFECAKVSAE